jgi:hypothetical protein
MDKATKAGKAKMGRPRTEIDLDMAERLGSIQCTLAECEAVMKIGVSTLSMRPDFLEAYKRGREKGKISLRRVMWKHAETNPTACIWLSKQYLGMQDNPNQEEEDEFKLIDNWPGGANAADKTEV